MTKEEAIEILKTLNEMYPRFELTKRKAAVLIPSLVKMDYEGVLENLAAYVTDHPYPPLLSEIAAYKSEEKSSLDEIEEWKQEAKNVSPEVKERFKQEFQRFVEAKGDTK